MRERCMRQQWRGGQKGGGVGKGEGKTGEGKVRRTTGRG